jgi:hypothetical protein
VRPRGGPFALAGWIALATLVRGQSPPAPRPELPRIAGSEISSEQSWQRTSNLTVESHSVVFGAAPFHIAFTITYPGLNLSTPPESVEVLLVRDAPSADDVRTAGDAPPVVVLIDGLPVPMTRQTSDGTDRIMSVVPLEMFEWMVGGEALAFEVFGRRLELAPDQLKVLKQIGGDWEHPTKIGNKNR